VGSELSRFHLRRLYRSSSPRAATCRGAVNTCRAVGIDAAGLGVPDWGTYPDGQMAHY